MFLWHILSHSRWNIFSMLFGYFIFPSCHSGWSSNIFCRSPRWPEDRSERGQRSPRNRFVRETLPTWVFWPELRTVCVFSFISFCFTKQSKRFIDLFCSEASEYLRVEMILSSFFWMCEILFWKTLRNTEKMFNLIRFASVSQPLIVAPVSLHLSPPCWTMTCLIQGKISKWIILPNCRFHFHNKTKR